MKDRSMYDQNPSIFQQFVLLTTQKQIMIEKIIKKIKTNYRDKEVKFLDIGCADGAVTIPIIEQLHNIIATGIETSNTLINDFKRKTNISVEFINENVELLDTLPNSDFILISHVLPYINDLESFVDKVLKALNKNGTALIVINNPSSDDVRVKEKILNQKKYTSLSSDMQKLLKEKKVLFDIEVVESTIDVSGISKMNNNGKSIIEFFYHEKYENISDDNIQNMRNLILNYSNEDSKLVKKEDYLWISK